MGSVDRTCRVDDQCHNGEIPPSRVPQWRPYSRSNATRFTWMQTSCLATINYFVRQNYKKSHADLSLYFSTLSSPRIFTMRLWSLLVVIDSVTMDCGISWEFPLFVRSHWHPLHSSNVRQIPCCIANTRLVPVLFAGCRFCFVCAALHRVSLSIASFSCPWPVSMWVQSKQIPASRGSTKRLWKNLHLHGMC